MVPLGNFLSGMETPTKRDHQNPPSPLETSLVEWKHIPAHSTRPLLSTLETSLVEWKPAYSVRYRVLVPTLETSLVEWKRGKRGIWDSSYFHLGNFLSGMETNITIEQGSGKLNLGNFLSGMETYGESGVSIHLDSLGNFLSGMETQVS